MIRIFLCSLLWRCIRLFDSSNNSEWGVCHRFGLNTKRAGRLRFGFAWHNTWPIVVIARVVIIVSSVRTHRATCTLCGIQRTRWGRRRELRGTRCWSGGKMVIGHRRDGTWTDAVTYAVKSENTREFRRLPILYGFSISYVFWMAWDSSCAGRIRYPGDGAEYLFGKLISPLELFFDKHVRARVRK